MPTSDSTSSATLAQQLAAAFAPDSAVVQGWVEAQKTLKPWPKWLFDDEWGFVQVQFNGGTIATVSETGFEVAVDLRAYAGTAELGQSIVEDQMWPEWEERGYCHLEGSTEGWDSEHYNWIYPIAKKFDTLDEVIEELSFLPLADLVR